MSFLISPEELKGLIGKDDVKLVDARRREDYLQGHINQAISIPIHDVIRALDAESLRKLFSSKGISQEDTVVVYDDEKGVYAGRVAWSLEYIGHKKVKLLDLSYSDLIKHEYYNNKISKEEEKFKEGKLDINLNESILANLEFVKGLIESRDGFIIDVRERLNYLEAHIPTAQTMPWKVFIGDKKLFKDADRIKRLLFNRGIMQDSNIVTYCGGAGTLSGISFYALRLAGFSKVRLYVRSFLEWKELNLPVEVVKDANYWDLSAY
ncbi:MAG: rhodanese-like domain-containing protein [Nitrososphaerales archaeon]